MNRGCYTTLGFIQIVIREKWNPASIQEKGRIIHKVNNIYSSPESKEEACSRELKAGVRGETQGTGQG